MKKISLAEIKKYINKKHIIVTIAVLLTTALLYSVTSYLVKFNKYTSKSGGEVLIAEKNRYDRQMEPLFYSEIGTIDVNVDVDAPATLESDNVEPIAIKESKDKYTIELYTANNRKAAEELIRKLRKKGVKNGYFTLDKSDDGKIVFKIRIGNYKNSILANKALNKFQQSKKLKKIENARLVKVQ
jgi:hypothetical protein